MLRQCSLFDEPPAGLGVGPLARAPRLAIVPGRVHAVFYALVPSDEDALRLHAHGRRVEEALGIALANTGERVVRQRIAPHMTVSWRGRRIPETPIDPVRWRASELVLIDSHHGEGKHEVLGRWTLSG